MSVFTEKQYEKIKERLMDKMKKGQTGCKYMKRHKGVEKTIYCKCAYGCEFKKIEGREILCKRLKYQ